jgi:cob(I)alamin adenosyltransferase
MRCAAALAYDKGNAASKRVLPEDGSILIIEREIDKIEATLNPLHNFILPGGAVLVSYCHIARCVCRRAERAVLRLNETEEVPEIVLIFLNRLSDYLFVLSRKIGFDLDSEEVKWSV